MQKKLAIASILKSKTDDQLFAPLEASEYLGVSQDTLAVWRCTGRYAIPYIKVGRLIRYRRSALDDFLNRRTRGAAEVQP